MKTLPGPPPPPVRAFQRILAATDLTPTSKKAFRRALALARDLEARLILAHVWTVPPARSVFFISIDPRSMAAIRARHRDKVARRFADYLRGEELGGVAVETVFLEGVPHQEIVRYAAREGVDLIVVGERAETRAQHLLRHLAFESVGERVRRTAPCAVLTVR